MSAICTQAMWNANLAGAFNGVLDGVLSVLRDQEFFKKVYVDDEAGTVAWPVELHIDPNTLYDRRISINVIKYLAEIMDFKYIELV